VAFLVKKLSQNAIKFINLYEYQAVQTETFSALLPCEIYVKLLLLQTFNITKMQSINYHTLITALRHCWTVSSCQTPPLISIMSIILDQTMCPSCQPLHTHSTSFYHSPYSFSSQSGIPSMLILSHSHFKSIFLCLFFIIIFFTFLI